MTKKSGNKKKPDALRMKAEKNLQQLTSNAIEKLSPDDSHQLIHELQVHQIELELQNEELRTAQEELEMSRSKYADLYDFAPVGYFTLDKNGLVVEANLTGAVHLDIDRNKIIKKPFSMFVNKEEQDVFFLHRRNVFKLKTRLTCELTLIKPDKTGFYAQLISIAIKDSKGNYNLMMTAVMNISERKKLETEMMDIQKILETRVSERTSELEKINETLSAEIQERARITKELQEKNIALKVLLQQRDEDRVEMEQNILSNINSLIQPYLDRLIKSSELKKELAYLNIIESNLNEIVSPFSNKLASTYMNFSPREIQVANLIKEGRQDKDIMEILKISFETVKTHRQNIRKKMGIYGKKTNLKTSLRIL